jgi:ferric-dicitrate binding protein FerR (iron transport regulator)
MSEYHQHLLLGKVTHALSDDEVVEFENLLSGDREFELAYKELISKLPASMVETGFKKMDAPSEWRDLASELKRKAGNKRMVVKRIAAMAAVFIGLFCIGWYLLAVNNRPGKATLPLNSNAANVQMKLANGKIIQLTNNKEMIKTGAVSLDNDGNNLSFAVNDKKESGINTIYVPTGKDYKITLSDGSEIWMNAQTTLSFPFYFSDSVREVTIHGEAYCKIAKNKESPFILHLPESTVTVLGTEFNVNTYLPDKTVVSLMEGKVNFTGGSSTQSLEPGKQIVFDGENFTKNDFNSRTVLSWQQGIFYMDEANIAEIADVLNRWFGVTVIVENPDLYKKRFAGIIDKKLPLNDFLSDLNAIAKITSVQKGSEVHFK